MRLEVAGLAADKLAVDVERAQRILVCDPARLLETLAHAGGAKSVLDGAGLIAAIEVEQQLAGLSLDQRGTVAHDDAAFVIDEFQRRDRAVRIDERAPSLDTSLDRIDMLAAAEQFLGHTHLEQIIEGETILATA